MNIFEEIKSQNDRVSDESEMKPLASCLKVNKIVGKDPNYTH